MPPMRRLCAWRVLPLPAIEADDAAQVSARVAAQLNAAVRDGRIKKGDLVLLEAMGGGFTWGSVLVRW